MNLDDNSLLASLFAGLIGAAFFMYGKRQGRLPQMVVGVALVVYPYFVSSVALMGAIAVGLFVALWAAIRLGL
jgi:4-hydroxybenzoate polyprenyltransferase